jgi:hypothetical protein
MDYNEYLSDDEIISDENENTIYDINGMPIYQEDEDEYNEMLKIINNKEINSNTTDELFVTKVDKKCKEIKEFKKKSLTITDLNILLDKKMEQSKPAKFLSKRNLEKKEHSNSINVEQKVYKKRCFNPRLPPYFLSDQYRNKHLKNDIPITISENNFPSLC